VYRYKRQCWRSTITAYYYVYDVFLPFVRCNKVFIIRHSSAVVFYPIAAAALASRAISRSAEQRQLRRLCVDGCGGITGVGDISTSSREWRLMGRPPSAGSPRWRFESAARTGRTARPLAIGELCRRLDEVESSIESSLALAGGYQLKTYCLE